MIGSRTSLIYLLILTLVGSVLAYAIVIKVFENAYDNNLTELGI